MTKEEKVKKYIKENPDVDFHLYLKNRLKNKRFMELFEKESARSEIALEVLRLRRAQKLTQAQLAKKIKIPQSNIARIERGAHFPAIKTLVKIFEALGQSVKITIGKKNIPLNP